MKSNRFTFGHVFIAKDDGRSTIRILESTPTPLEQKNLGQLFAVMEIDSDDSVNEDVLDLIAEDIHAAYYASENFSVETAFEDALQTTNKKLQEIIAEIGENWLPHLNIVIGVQKDSQIVFANLGQVMVLLLQGQTIIDVLDSTQARNQPINAVKVFSNIVAGKIPEQASVVVATENLLDYLSKEKIRRIVIDTAPDKAVEAFTGLLQDDTGSTNFAAIIIGHAIHTVDMPERVLTTPTIDVPVVNKPDTSSRLNTDSMADLLGKQNQTAELLSSSLWPSLKKTMSDSWKNLQAKREDRHSERGHGRRSVPVVRGAAGATSVPKPRRDWKQLAQSAGSISKTAAVVAGRGLKAAGIGAVKAGRSVQHTVQERRRNGNSPYGGSSYNAGRRNGRLQIGTRSAGKLFQRVMSWFSGLSVVQKIFFGLAIVLLFVFAQGVVNRGEKQQTDQTESAYAGTLSQVDIKVNEGKAAVLFDADVARGLFIEARDLLATVPTDSDVYGERGAELQTVIDEQLRVANNIQTVDSAETVLDYSRISTQLAIGRVILLGASVYAFDANTAAVYRGNLETGDVSVSVSDGGVTPVIAAMKASPGTGIVALRDGNVATFNPVAESFTTLELDGLDSSTLAAIIFGTRLYALAPTSGQIIRFQKTDDAFDAGSDWISDGSSVAGAVDMAIDGDIYVVTSSGTLERYTQGVKAANFSLGVIDPALQAVTRVVTDENMQNLYLLESDGDRIVAYSKDGQLVAQYSGQSINGVSDIIVDEPGGRILTVSGNQIRSIPLSGGPIGDTQ